MNSAQSTTRTNSVQAPVDAYAVARTHERETDRLASGIDEASFAYGRRNAILDLMRDRCGGACMTDDAEIFAEVLIPFLVEAAAFHLNSYRQPRDPYIMARACLGHALPRWAAEHSDRIADLVHQAMVERAAAVEAHDPAMSRHVLWLPSMQELVNVLRPTREEVSRLGLHGWGCIDPLTTSERRAADAARKRAARAAKGATPRDQSLTRLKPWETEGISRSSWYERQKKQASEVRTDSSVPYREREEADETVQAPVPNNDNAPHVTAEIEVAGYQGRHLTLSASDVERIVELHPVLAGDLRAHLDVIDNQMKKTPKENHRAVLKNLLRDRVYAAHRHNRLALAA